MGKEHSIAARRAIDGIIAGAGESRGRVDEAPLDRRDLGRDADQDAGPEPGADHLMGLADEVREHLLRRVEVGDHAVLDRPDGAEMARAAAQHLAGSGADRFDHAADGVEGDERGLVQDDALTLGVDTGVGRAEIDSEVGSEVRECHGFAAQWARSIPAAAHQQSTKFTTKWKYRGAAGSSRDQVDYGTRSPRTIL